MFHLLKQYVGNGDESLKMPFDIYNHKLQFIDPYDFTETTRPFQYLSEKPLQLLKDLEQDPDRVTCFR